MKSISKIWLAAGVLISTLSCSNKPQPIDYGNDGCHYCKMTIVDKLHAAELVTQKGKVYKFDASECMIRYLEENPAVTYATLVTNYYEAPREFVASEAAFYLISPSLPSPMGANLTAFKNKDIALGLMAEKGGQLYTWSQLKVHLEY